MLPDPTTNNAITSGAILHVRDLRLLRHLIIFHVPHFWGEANTAARSPIQGRTRGTNAMIDLILAFAFARDATLVSPVCLVKTSRARDERRDELVLRNNNPEPACPFCATTRLMRCSKQSPKSITSSARARIRRWLVRAPWRLEVVQFDAAEVG
jgi:hypothetical protein